MTSTLITQRELPLPPPTASLHEALEWAVAHAVLATCTADPGAWTLRANVDDAGRVARVELLLARPAGRSSDPDHRAAILSGGAALLNVRLALNAVRLGSTFSLLPDPLQPDLLAVLTVQGRTAEQSEDRVLREAVPVGVVGESSFLPAPLPAELVERLITAAGYEGGFAVALDPDPGAGPEPTVLVLAALGADRPSLMRAGAGLQRMLLTASAAGCTTRFLPAALRTPAVRDAAARAVPLEHLQVVLQVGYSSGDGCTPGKPTEDVLTVVD